MTTGECFFFLKYQIILKYCNRIKLHWYQAHVDSHPLNANQKYSIHVHVMEQIYTIK